MTTIHESYLAVVNREHSTHECIRVLITASISYWVRRTTYDIHCPALAPDKSTLQDYKRTQNQDLYMRDFLQKLQQKPAIRAMEELVRQAKLENKDIVLICYEKRGSFCHRYTVQNLMEMLV